MCSKIAPGRPEPVERGGVDGRALADRDGGRRARSGAPSRRRARAVRRGARGGSSRRARRRGPSRRISSVPPYATPHRNVVRCPCSAWRTISPRTASSESCAAERRTGRRRSEARPPPPRQPMTSTEPFPGQFDVRPERYGFAHSPPLRARAYRYPRPQTRRAELNCRADGRGRLHQPVQERDAHRARWADVAHRRVPAREARQGRRLRAHEAEGLRHGRRRRQDVPRRREVRARPHRDEEHAVPLRLGRRRRVHGRGDLRAALAAALGRRRRRCRSCSPRRRSR